MSLSDTACRNAKPGLKPSKNANGKSIVVPVSGAYKLAAGKGLYLLVSAVGKYWRLDYRFMGKRKTLALGVYPDVSLAAARDRCDDARRLLATDIDPSLHRQLEKGRKAEGAASSFESVAIEWLAKYAGSWSEDHGAKIKRRLERDVFPWIGARPVAEITAPELLAVLRRIEGRGALETAHRAHQNCGQVFRYAIATGAGGITRDPAADLRGALPPVSQTHHASITDPKGIAELLRALRGYQGSFVTSFRWRRYRLRCVRW